MEMHRPLTPGPGFGGVDVGSESSSYGSVKPMSPWQPTPTAPRHRAAAVSGWLCVPRSVVMATTLDRKHSDQLKAGALPTVCDVINEKRRRKEEMTKLNEARNKMRNQPRKGAVRKAYDQPQVDYYQKLLEENLTQVKELAQIHEPDRYVVVDASKCDDDYTEAANERVTEDELSNLERSLDQWKHSFIRRSVDSSQISTVSTPASNQPPLTHRTRDDRPFTADSTLRSQSDKASENTLLRPPTAEYSSINSTARKSIREKVKYKWETSRDLRNLLPGYPRRVVRNRRHHDHMTHNRKSMTTQSTWFPLSFSEEMRGRLVAVSSDMYGYDSVAEYKELCRGLNDGMAVIEQLVEVGDSVQMKIVATDRRKDLMYVAACKPNDDPGNPHSPIPANRLVPAATPCDWIFSNEITGLKAGDDVTMTLDALGRLKCEVTGKPPIVVLQLIGTTQCRLALFLGVGVTKLQLLGGHKMQRSLLHPSNSYEIVPGIRSSPNLASPHFVYRPPEEKCSFCANSCAEHGELLTSPYVCDHVMLCAQCRHRVECVLCSAPLCWFSCPVCDTRTQTYKLMTFL